MIYRSLLNRFIYLIGLMVTCFLHFSCHSLSSSMLGDSPSSNTNDQTQSASDSVALSNEAGKVVLQSFAVAGQGKRDNKVQTGSAENNAIASTAISPEGKVNEALGKTFDGWCKALCGQECKERCKREAATTCCLAIIDKDKLQCANIGDSGLYVVRKGEVVFKTEEKVKSFNRPHALAIVKDKKEDKTGKTLKLETYECFIGEFELKSGDVVVMATDGVFDNLFDEELSSIVDYGSIIKPNNTTKPNYSAQEIAHNIVTEVLAISKDTKKETPFAHKTLANVKTFYNQNDSTIDECLGGKKDDISVVVAIY